MSFPSSCFKRKEFACHCGCGKDTVDTELLVLLNSLRNSFGRPVIVTSGYRCSSHNMSVNGAKGSFHLVGKAADIIVSGVPSEQVYSWLTEACPDKYGVGLYQSWVHIDVRDAKARWGK